jgi:argininosuccinate lyase
LENTGRISSGITPSARRVIFGTTADDSIDTELRYVAQVDRAHLVMLAEQNIVDRQRACRLLNVIDELDTHNFEPLRNKPALRGLYLLYEDYLTQQLGSDTGGILQTARSRNDLNATVLRLRLRTLYVDLVREALRLQAVLLRRVRLFGDVVMPAYTHYQAAVPITYGHYLAGVASSLERDIDGMISASTDLDRCPLGAGAVGGTSFPIQPGRTASLLGFDGPARHSIDAVASRDLILRLLASASILGITISRLAADLLLWTTAEFAFLSLPDSLIGSSSMMPQKRNPFLLEHVQGRSAAALGAFVNSATAMHAKPFTNSISVGTEAVSPVWNALKGTTESLLLTRLVVAGARPQQAAMLRRAEQGYTVATELANRLVSQQGMPFRSAHFTVGSIIRGAIENGEESLTQATARWHNGHERPISFDGLDPTSVVQASAYGGGPSRQSLQSCFAALRDDWQTQIAHVRYQSRKWSVAGVALNEAVRQLCSQASS